MRSLISTLALVGAATARIVGMAGPATIAPNSNITVTLITENYIQSVKDLSAAFALSPQLTSGFLGTSYLGSFYLGPEKSNVLTNLTFSVTTPSDLTGINYITGAVNSLYGVSNGPVTLQFNVPTTVGTQTSTEQNSDIGGINGDCFASTPSDPGDNTTTSTPPSTGPTGVPETCSFPTQTQNLIQTSIQDAQLLINSIVQGNNQTGQQNLGELNGSLGDVFRAVDVNRQGEGACHNPAPGPWPPLSPGGRQVRAISILQDAQSGLQALSGDVLECDVNSAFSVVGQVLRLVDEVDGYYSS